MQYNKKFVIIGNANNITYKDFFPLIKDNKVWLGYTTPKEFITNLETKASQKFGNTCWYTNLDHKKRHEELILTKSYNPTNYPTYDNYNAIEVSKVVNIPKDYAGAMGVPITFLDKYNPHQFEIISDSRYHDGQDFADDINFINGKCTYRRIIIKYKNIIKEEK
jgi:hypothetical protein